MNFSPAAAAGRYRRTHGVVVIVRRGALLLPLPGPPLPAGEGVKPSSVGVQRHGRPEIFNTDQGCQFTSEAFTRVLKDAGIAISMDGKGCWRDNVFVERLWKSIKYEEVYLKAYDTVSHARQSLASYICFYNARRPHSRLDRRTPDQVYFNQPLPIPKAA